MPTWAIQNPQMIFPNTIKTLLNTYITLYQEFLHLNIEHLKTNYTLNIRNKLVM